MWMMPRERERERTTGNDLIMVQLGCDIDMS